MKAFCLVILTFCVLYNPKVEAKTYEVALNSIDQFAAELSAITIDTEAPLKNVDRNLRQFETLMGIMENMKVHNINLSEKLLYKIQNQNTFSGDDLYLIKRTTEVFFIGMDKILTLGELYQFKPLVMRKTFAAPQMNKDLIKAHLMWLTSNLIIMEKMQAVHKILYENEGGFRRIFKYTFDPEKTTQEEKNSLKDATNHLKELTEVVEDKNFAQQVILVREINEKISQSLGEDKIAKKLLTEVITNEVASDLAHGKSDFKLNLHMAKDATVNTFNRITNILSAFFGNVMGSLHWRKGRLYGNEQTIKNLKTNLQPMDIILEKSPFTMTDKFIPGHFGHVAIYLGTKEQLSRLGLWDHPKITPYHAEIVAGKTILEAVRSGVRLNSIEEFLNIDEYTIVRKTDGIDSFAQVSEQIDRGMDQLGKAYDFNFDISTLDKIVCSELIYIVFGHVNWPTQYRLGRPTVTPDNIGEILFKKNSKFIMTEYVTSSKRQGPKNLDIQDLADIYDYELRTENAEEIKDVESLSFPTNRFWKKETKCYKVSLGKKACKTTYKEYTYEEEPGI